MSTWPDRTPLATGPVLGVAAGLVALLAAVGGRYGYHRDELYFIEAGYHPAWSYPDQPALVPVLARAWHAAVGGSLWGFRLLPALLAAAVVVLAASTCAELGGDRRAQLLAAAATATSATLLAVGHLFSTTTFDAALSTAAVWLLVRALRTGSVKSWLLLGLAVGMALNVKLLPALVLASCAVGLLVAGPRGWLRSPWPYVAVLPALALAAPALAWQAAHGWPQLDVASSIAQGGSATSVDRPLVLALQPTLTGPLTFWLVVVAVVAAARSRSQRWVAVAYAVLLAAVVATGGKPYYTLALLPVLLAVAAGPVLRWSGGRPGRGRLVVGLLLANLAGSAVLTLPVLPATAVNPLLAVNPDHGAQIGWPAMVDAVQAASRGLAPADRAAAVIVTDNYGEAGALAAARRAGRDLPPVHSGHNAFGAWGPPPAAATSVLWVGWTDDPRMATWFRGCSRVAAVDTPGLENEEEGATVSLCRLARPWSQVWPELVHLG